MPEAHRTPLDVLAVSLPGLHVVEASAGTGKTYNITALYLRLLLETDLGPDRILVVTYTVAATAELKTRIRRSVADALEAFRSGASPDPFLTRLLDRYADRERAARRLGNALRTFDEAAIFTIHGFCQRVLTESAFESGASLRTEMLGDQSEILAECVEDFWRRETYEGSAPWTRFLVDEDVDPEKLRAQVAGLVGKPFERVFVPGAVRDVSDEEGRWEVLLARARALWATERGRVFEILDGDGALKRNVYQRRSIPGWCDGVDGFLEATSPPLRLPTRFERFTPEDIAQGTKKGGVPPSHPFFEICADIVRLQAELESAYRARLGEMRARLLAFCNDEIRRRKEERRVRWFDDLLIDLERALASEASGPALARTLRERYGAALIDEFQDTDPLQYSIFRRIYADGSAPVFLVGDPKQAIYAFRGADVFAYLQARRDARDRYTLDENHRSDRSVVEGVNALFGSHENPFVLEDIPFLPARPAYDDRASEFLAATGLPAVRAWLLPRTEDGKPLTSDAASTLVAEATADEIARLLESGAHLPDGRIHGGNVAVLVRTHGQGQLVRRALSARGVAAVEESQQSVFSMVEAEEIERVLAGIAEPIDERLVRGALSTSLLGFTADRLVQLAESEQAWDAEIAAFHEYRRTWLGAGFGQMFRRLLHEREVPRRLLETPDGERRLTNVLQIGELLSAEATSAHGGCEKLLQWLATRRSLARRGGASSPTEHLLRLESDDQLVQISTLHGAKGLEYEIVFVPFAWSSIKGERKDAFVTFHLRDGDSGRPCVDFGSEESETHRRWAEWEALAEDLRLFYVAVTRAKHHCTFAWGAVRGADCAAPAWLFHGACARGGDGSEPLSIPFQSRTHDEMRSDLAARASGAVAVEALPPPPEGGPRRISLPPVDGSAPLVARTLERDVRNRWRITSFSALRSGRGADLADRDQRAIAVVAEPETPGRDLFSFPRGSRAGLCFHRLFELCDFTAADPPAVRRLVGSTLAEFGFPSWWEPTVEKMVLDVLATPLDDAHTLRLGDVGRARRLAELEFHYPAGRLTLDGLNDLLVAHGYPVVPERGDAEELPRPLVDGYVKGYVDLVFEAGGRYYLGDYKSNWLGSTLESYAPEVLRDVIRQELYTLQYVTYTLALHRLLRLRVPDYDYDRHVGGAYYLFLRGMRPERGPASGVFFDRPPRALVEELDARIGATRARGTGGVR